MTICNLCGLPALSETGANHSACEDAENMKPIAPKRKNPDYSASAEHLCNPRAVEENLFRIRQLQMNHTLLNAQAQALIPNEVKARIAELEFSISEATKTIRDLIDQQGSYQNVENGHYALKMRKISKQYHAEPFLAQYPQYAPAVIVQTINVNALEGLIKGGLLGEASLLAEGVITKSETYTYIVK